ncbi:hypothetical protein N7532_004693 [Penicillium argentinense]|uniref:gamma-glutamylcyclotransferase n=1 Tax=Penicillium argentinense TaxID=1131581 RepID=A0A9W9FPZ0_9EURO|nr:uncharacterized protein N7532_004693 [Penicillium argentinense]KAJ5104164.1 hypothetical protein N7532_004693 [Penicillium argentinense]
MAQGDPPRPLDEEAAPTPSRRRFNAIEPPDRLRDIPSAILHQPEDTQNDIDMPPTTSKQRRRASSQGASLDQDVHLVEKITEHHDEGEALAGTAEGEESVLYLAYGSNLASKTFLGMRKIKPLSQIPVLVPELRLTFDLPGIPYVEPCFAGTDFRNPDAPEEQDSESSNDESSDLDGEFLSEKAPLMVETRELRACSRTRQWNKPLVGVVYEVTLADYAKIIATEGGGRGYRDIVIDCHPFSDGYKSTDPVPNHPNTPSFKAHTLLSPAADDARKQREALQNGHKPAALSPYPGASLFDLGPHMRPDPNYAQPSARYLNLLVTGAGEHDLPVSYQKYLSEVHTYRITTIRQKIGKVIFLLLWGPVVLSLLGLSKRCAGPDGRSPPWLVSLSNLVFAGLWNSYDLFFRRVFGDGERTLDS